MNQTKVRIYPNPNNGTFTVEHSINSKNYYIELIDLTGKIVHQEKLTTGNQQQIKPQLLNKGFYFVNFKSVTGELMYSTKMSVMK